MCACVCVCVCVRVSVYVCTCVRVYVNALRAQAGGTGRSPALSLLYQHFTIEFLDFSEQFNDLFVQQVRIGVPFVLDRVGCCGRMGTVNVFGLRCFSACSRPVRLYLLISPLGVTNTNLFCLVRRPSTRHPTLVVPI